MSIRQSIAAARTILAMYGSPLNPQAGIQPYREYIGGDEEVSGGNEFRTVVAAWVVYGRINVDVFITGIGGPTHGRNLAYGYADSTRLRSSFERFNSNSFADAHTLMDRADFTRRARGKRLRIWGHSAGGVVGEVVAKYAVLMRVATLESIVTFGAPKPGLPGACTTSTEGQRLRYMAPGDPVPLVPSSTPNTDLLIALRVRLADFEPWRMEHGSGGRQITQEGIREQTDALVTRQAAPLIEEWVARDPAAIRAHSIANYIMQLLPHEEEPDFDTANRRTARPQGIPGREPNFVFEVTMPGPSLVLPLPVQVATIANGVGRTTSGELVPVVRYRSQQMAQPRIIPGITMRVIRAGAVYSVFWMDYQVATFTSPSAARTFARKGNSWLRWMGNRSNIGVTEMSAAIAEFLASASNDQFARPPFVVH